MKNVNMVDILNVQYKMMNSNAWIYLKKNYSVDIINKKIVIKKYKIFNVNLQLIKNWNVNMYKKYLATNQKILKILNVNLQLIRI